MYVSWMIQTFVWMYPITWSEQLEFTSYITHFSFILDNQISLIHQYMHMCLSCLSDLWCDSCKFSLKQIQIIEWTDTIYITGQFSIDSLIWSFILPNVWFLSPRPKGSTYFISILKNNLTAVDFYVFFANLVIIHLKH